MVSPSLLMATLATVSECPSSLLDSLPVAISHIAVPRGKDLGLGLGFQIASKQFLGNFHEPSQPHRMVLSLDPDTMVLPSGLNAMPSTSPVCPCWDQADTPH